MARRQSTHTELAATATTIALTLNGVLSGSLLVVAVGTLTNATTTISGVQDDLGTVGVSVGRAIYGTNGYGEIWYIKNATAGNRTVTVTYSATITNRYMCLIEADADTASPFDQTGKKETQDSINPNTTSVPTTANGEYCVALSAGNPGTSLLATSPYGDVYTATLNSWTLGVEDQIQTSAGATNGAWTAANSSWFAILATFKAPTIPADRDIIIRYGSISAVDGSGLVMAAFANAAAAGAAAGGGLYPWYYRTLVADD